jgi:hypothetical protein
MRGMFLMRGSVSSVAVAAVLLAAPTVASAATTIGQAPPSRGTPVGCNTNSEYIQATVQSGTIYQAPFAGVITSWRTHVDLEAGRTLAMRVYHPTGSAGTYSPTSESAVQTLSGVNTVNEFPTRQRIEAGDSIGLRTGTPSTTYFCLTNTAESADDTYFLTPAAAVGTFNAYVPLEGFLVDVSATIEADADGDGFGDETQDQCPSDPATQGPCPAGGAGDTTPPETGITSGPKPKEKKGKATFEFSGSDARALAGFQCSLDDGPFESCTSPKEVKVKKGKHTFAVRATDSAGNTDPTPATQSWTVKKKKKKK